MGWGGLERTLKLIWFQRHLPLFRLFQPIQPGLGQLQGLGTQPQCPWVTRMKKLPQGIPRAHSQLLILPAQHWPSAAASEEKLPF